MESKSRRGWWGKPKTEDKMVIGHWTWTDTSIGPRSAEVRLQQPSAAPSPRGADRRGNSRIGHCGHGWVDILLKNPYCSSLLRKCVKSAWIWGNIDRKKDEYPLMTVGGGWGSKIFWSCHAKENLHEGEVLWPAVPGGNYIACSSFAFDVISITENVQCDKHWLWNFRIRTVT